jgi:hypothetical protein
MAELVNLVGSSGITGALISWMAVGAAALWLWERCEHTRTRVLIERERRTRIKRAQRSKMTSP